MMRASKRSKTAQCACGKVGEDMCSICQILMYPRKKLAQQWNELRLGNWSENWLNIASDIVVDGGSKDVVSIIAERRTEMSTDDIDVCAQLVSQLCRRNQIETARKIFAMCKRSFEKQKSELCIIASSFIEPLKYCTAEAYQIAKRARDKNRLEMAKCIADKYSLDMSF